MYNQQEAMYRLKCQRCDHRIVSIHQPHVRPIVRGKVGRPPKITEDNRAQFKQLQKQRREDYRQRIPIEGKFGQSDKAKTAIT